MRTANPALNDRAFYTESRSMDRSNVMTVNGAVAKTGFLTALLLAAAGVSWHLIFPMGVGAGGTTDVNRDYALGLTAGGLIGGLLASLVIIFSPRSSPIAAPIYAVCEGLFLGALSGFVSGQYQGIVLQAGLLTVGVLAVMLLAYSSGVIRATEKFKLGVIAATGAICMVYLATMVLSLFGVAVPYIHSAGPIGIGFSLVVVVIAALNLVLDFDVIEQGARASAPKYMEWYGAFGLLVTLVWLYIEILRLLIKLKNSD
ncbi:Bax inhibitor-1/YccA family protein [Limnoglobus roseus]|uniref:Bax inhibitor-1/YccA family protein n=1 Tax=Limnoglobus roseus TaxID=2598579 RepID=A0A5C1AKB9_9BACT|nr:Bax inhibitor-1/YccA family protein [Limnoglobus roseus]QEL17358.1 hypothetical protein PX52LOC_04342 [Limnoglobus roseus]